MRRGPTAIILLVLLAAVAAPLGAAEPDDDDRSPFGATARTGTDADAGAAGGDAGDDQQPTTRATLDLGALERRRKARQEADDPEAAMRDRAATAEPAEEPVADVPQQTVAVPMDRTAAEQEEPEEEDEDPLAAALALEAEDPDAWLARDHVLPRIGADLIAEEPLPRPIPPDYRLQPGDVVRVVTWGGTTVNDALAVGPGGNLGVPGFGAVPVAGLTQMAARDLVVELLRSHFRNAGAVLAVERAQELAVTVTGQVTQPGYLPVPGGATMLEALSAAGGVRANGTLRRIRVARPGAEPVEVDLYRVALDGDAAQIVPLAPGSRVHVPLAGPQVQVHGAVRRPGLIEVLPGQDLALALALAGGPAPSADVAALRLLREGPEGQQLHRLAVDDLAGMAVEDGDRLRVDTARALKAARSSVRVAGAVRSPGVHAYRTGLDVADLIAAAGGLLPEADLERAVIRRRLAEPRPIELQPGVTTLVHEDLLTHLSLETELLPLDLLEVPTGAPLEEQRLTVVVQGAVEEPGIYPLTPDMTVADLLRLGDGVTQGAQLEEADLIRVVIDADGRRDVERRPIDLRPIVAGDDRGPRLRNADTLVVRTRTDERVRVVLEGEVLNAGELVLPAGTTLGQAIAIAGGLTERAFPAGARYYRESEAEEAVRQLEDMSRRLDQTIAINRRQLAEATTERGRLVLEQTILKQEQELARIQRAQATGRMSGIDLVAVIDGAQELVLQDGDRLEVPAHPGTIRVLGEVMVPGSLRFEPGLHVREVIQRSGGVSRQSDEDRVFVVRADGSVVASAAFTGTHWDPERRKWVRTNLSRLELLEGDTVIVPPDLRFQVSGMELAKDWSQILFQIATAAGTVAVLAQ